MPLTGPFTNAIPITTLWGVGYALLFVGFVFAILIGFRVLKDFFDVGSEDRDW